MPRQKTPKVLGIIHCGDVGSEFVLYRCHRLPTTQSRRLPRCSSLSALLFSRMHSFTGMGESGVSSTESLIAASGSGGQLITAISRSLVTGPVRGLDDMVILTTLSCMDRAETERWRVALLLCLQVRPSRNAQDATHPPTYLLTVPPGVCFIRPFHLFVVAARLSCYGQC